MKIAAAQIQLNKSITRASLDKHVLYIDRAIEHNIEIIFFPELSLSGYEPSIINEEAIMENDTRLDIFRVKSKENNITICVGVPVPLNNKVAIGMFIFKPDGTTQLYMKQYLHHCEEQWFTPGNLPNHITVNGQIITLAVCYESKIEEHIQDSIKKNPVIHLIPVVEDSIENKIEVMKDKAKKYKLSMLIANCVGQTGDYACNGRSCFIDEQGNVDAQMDATSEGMLILDLVTKKTSIIIG
jgi:predicted amidohydrolase